MSDHISLAGKTAVLVRELAGEGIRAARGPGGVRRALVGSPGKGFATFTVGVGGSGIDEGVER